MTALEPSFRVRVDVTNPGQFFACCGLLELASRLTSEAVGWFEQDTASHQWYFLVANTSPLADLLGKITAAEITIVGKSEEDKDEGGDDLEDDESENEEKDASAPPLLLGSPFNLRLDWWITASAKTSTLKVWAGSMKVHNIARSMSYAIQQSLCNPAYVGESIFTNFQITYDLAKIEKARRKIEQTCATSLNKAGEKQVEALKKAEAEMSGEKLEKEKNKIACKYEADVAKAKSKREQSLANITAKADKIEPFYFDANRGPNAHSRDVGFATNDLKMKTFAAPAVELLTLIGLQRAIPVPVPDAARIFDYHVWTKPLSIALVSAAIVGLLPDSALHGYRFESWFRTGQRKHKAFLSAKLKPQP